MKLNEAIINIRVELQNTKLKKSGQNKFAGFNYYELSDFLPTLNALMLKYGVNDLYTVENEEAILTLILGDDMQSYKMPFTQFMTPTNKSGQPSMQDIQYLGALNTYFKRYLYLNAFGITDGEVIDAMRAPEVAPRTQYKTASGANEAERKAYREEFYQRAGLYGFEQSMFSPFLDFLGVDKQNGNAVHNATVKYLKDENLLGEQIVMFIEYVRKQAS